jgi:hypothetical protein
MEDDTDIGYKSEENDYDDASCVVCGVPLILASSGSDVVVSWLTRSTWVFGAD